MKSRIQRKNLRRSIRKSRKIQKGGMSISDATTMLMTKYKLSMGETIAVVSGMAKDGEINDSVFHATVMLNKEYNKSWTEAILLVLSFRKPDGSVNMPLLLAYI